MKGCFLWDTNELNGIAVLHIGRLATSANAESNTLMKFLISGLGLQMDLCTAPSAIRRCVTMKTSQSTTPTLPLLQTWKLPRLQPTPRFPSSAQTAAILLLRLIVSALSAAISANKKAPS